MLVSRLLLPTLREAPADAEIISHQLMLRAGLIRQLAAGIYTWLPLGLRVLRKVEAIVREEMDAAGAQEVLMSGVQPAELWEESGRWEAYGPELLRLADRHDRAFCLGPTHEEIITDLARRELRSYKQLPANFYQIQTKFRDEVRPRFGVMRAREFIMKDAYSFHMDSECLGRTYEEMHAAYSRIFSRLGLNFRAVVADSGNIGGQTSHEFHVLADSGEDEIVFSDTGDYAANIELAPCPSAPAREAATAEKARHETPGVKTIEAVSEFLNTPIEQCLKTLMVEGEDGVLVALVLRGDHSLNPIKAANIEGVTSPLQMAAPEKISATTGCDIGSLGPCDLQNVRVIVDHYAAAAADFVCGANANGWHFSGMNWGRDLPEPEVADLRNVTAGEASPDGKGKLALARGIEVGHIFQLGTKYSEALKATCLDENGKATTLSMGCYGIGCSRIVAAAIEQNHDERGIIWPSALAPWQVYLAPVNAHKSVRLMDAAKQLYEQLTARGIDVLFDDRRERPGVMFTDQELIGVPHRIVLSDRGLDEGKFEYKPRTGGDTEYLALENAVDEIAARLG